MGMSLNMVIIVCIALYMVYIDKESSESTLYAVNHTIGRTMHGRYIWTRRTIRKGYCLQGRWNTINYTM